MAEPSPLDRIRSAEDEAVSPKYARRQRERRWLVDAERLQGLALTGPVAVSDRYIADTRLRLREMRDGDRVVRKLTKKYDAPDPCDRPIVTVYLGDREFELLAALPATTIQKTRYRLGDGRHMFSVDWFEGALAGLLLAGIELEDLAALRALPDPVWTVRDVTNELGYQGATLARHGRPKE